MHLNKIVASASLLFLNNFKPLSAWVQLIIVANNLLLINFKKESKKSKPRLAFYPTHYRLHQVVTDCQVCSFFIYIHFTSYSIVCKQG